MGYACPVCRDPQADDEHLANHLAFTAMLGDDEHEAWLDEHAPGWGGAGPTELAGRVVEYAESVEFPQVFEDTTGRRDHEHAHRRERGGGETEDEYRPRRGTVTDPDDETRRVLAQARELTRRMLDEDADREAETAEGDDGAAQGEHDGAEDDTDSGTHS